MKKSIFAFTTAAVVACLSPMLLAQTAPLTYNAYTGTDTKAIPPAPALGAANTVITDPTFGSRILRVTDANTKSGQSFISTDAGFQRAWNANSTAIKLTGPHGDGYWLEFNPSAFTVGNGSSAPAVHQVPFGARWEWSTVDPDIIYFLNGNQIAKYNKSTGVVTNLGGPSNGDAVTYMAVVVGLDNWVCSAAGPGSQNTYTKIFCLNPLSPSTSKFIDVYNKTINGVPQTDLNWPTSAPGQIIGVHDVSGGTGASWLEVTFHQQSWGANGGAVFNLATNTWSLVTAADIYWSGHVSMGNGRYANSAGSTNGSDSRGMLLRNPDNLMNSSDYRFIEQPPNTLNGWCDADHNSWFNSLSNPGAPILSSRYTIVSPCNFAWAGEIVAAAVDGSNTVWRFAHTHNSGSCYYTEGFAQISNDGNWALFSSSWDGTLGIDTAFGCTRRIDTFIVRLGNSITPPPPGPVITTTSLPNGTQNTPYSATLAATGGTSPYVWSVTAGSLPNGLSLNANAGVISGTPRGSGTSTFTVQVRDANSQTSTASLSLTINRRR
jgi:putative Ig domain-containing protein